MKYCWESVKIVFGFNRYAVSGMVAVMVVSSAMLSLQLLAIQKLTGALAGLLAGGGLAEVWSWGALLAAAFVWRSLSGYLMQLANIAIDAALAAKLLPQVVEKLQRLEYACFEDSAVQDCMQRMSAEPQAKIKENFSQVSAVLQNGLSLCGVLGYFLSVSLVLAAGYVLLIGLQLVFSFKSLRLANSIFDAQTPDERKMRYYAAILAEKDTAFELNLFGAVGYIVNKFRQLIGKVFQERLRVTMKTQKQYLGLNILLAVYNGFVLGYAGWQTAAGAMDAGVLVAIVASGGELLQVIEIFLWGFYKMLLTSREVRYFREFSCLPERCAGNGALPAPDGDIVFENVCFTYPGSTRKVLDNLNCTIGAGKHVALVGENGAGKSTLAKLLLGLYRPDSGRITIGGTDLREISDSARRKLFSAIFQDYAAYSLTLRENVALGDIAALRDDERLLETLQLAQTQGLAGENSDGLERQLGKLTAQATDLSGGQWQRLAIARALLPDSRYVILDEPAAALDPLAESRLYDDFIHIMKQRGAIIITHRLASARLADEILVLDGGTIVERGGHEQLLRQNGLYAAMYQVQASWYVTAGACGAEEREEGV